MLKKGLNFIRLSRENDNFLFLKFDLDIFNWLFFKLKSNFKRLFDRFIFDDPANKFLLSNLNFALIPVSKSWKFTIWFSFLT